jgi:large subunit ribosomal protein L15
MELSKLPKTTAGRKKRVGRGIGSGKGGHTSGRGQKGQKSRSKVGLLFEGTKVRKSLIKRLPMMRGKLRNKSFAQDHVILNVKYLNLLKDKTEVTVESLIKAGLVTEEARQYGVKILGDGELQKSLTVKLPTSKGAQKKIEKAGGKVLEADVPEVSEVAKVGKVEKKEKPAVKKKTVSKKNKKLGKE